MKKNNIWIVRTIFLVIAFVLMCVFKLWYTLLLIFFYGIFIAFLKRNKMFCYNTCPLGTLMDFSFEKKNKSIILKNKDKFKVIILALYLFYIVFIILTFHKESYNLWRYFLYLMLFSMFLGLISQEIYGKRFWCVNLCPLSKMMDIELNILKNNK